MLLFQKMIAFGFVLLAVISLIVTAYQQPFSPSANQVGCNSPNRGITTPNACVVLSRSKFNALVSSSLPLSALISSKVVNAFDGGVGGLGKTKPQTNVVFANPEMIEADINTPGDYNAELIAPDGTLIFLSFYAPWPMLKSQGIESRDLANGESSFVQVANVPKNNVPGTALSKQFFVDSVFGSTGKYGMYGSPTDVKIRKVDTTEGNNDLYVASFTTLTPAMRESDRKAYISASIVGGGVFMLVSGTTTSRWKTQEPLLRKTAESFICTEAPKSSFRK